ncbi:MAG TPA: cysteine desulfurase [archaeon]|nr:cysteine desulfurase [archaeon]
MNIEKIRQDFPILKRKINGKKLVYLDNAATSQKPLQVINAITDFYSNNNANIHRGTYTLSQEASSMYENARKNTASFIEAEENEIVFTRNATESLNLAAYTLTRELKEGDEILISKMEHHANLVPWQQLSKERKLKLKFIDVKKDFTLDYEQIPELISNKTKIVSLTHCSNVLGTINELREVEKLVHDNNSYFIIDASQSVPHFPVSVKKLNPDFMAFSGHKMLGPAGIGVLYGKQELLEEMNPFLFGGDMVEKVTLMDSSWNKVPEKFEAGTPNIAGAIGLSAAIDYLNKTGMEKVFRHEKELLSYALEKLSELNEMKIFGPEKEKRAAVVPFTFAGIHSHDIAQVLDSEGIAIRAGNHCAQPLMAELGLEGIARASFYIYNSKEEIDLLAKGLMKAEKIFK